MTKKESLLRAINQEIDELSINSSNLSVGIDFSKINKTVITEEPFDISLSEGTDVYRVTKMYLVDSSDIPNLYEPIKNSDLNTKIRYLEKGITYEDDGGGTFTKSTFSYTGLFKLTGTNDKITQFVSNQVHTLLDTSISGEGFECNPVNLTLWDAIKNNKPYEFDGVTYDFTDMSLISISFMLYHFSYSVVRFYFLDNGKVAIVCGFYLD